MPVLVYHTLVARESSTVDKGWKSSIVWLLCVTIFAAHVTSFSVSLMYENFNKNCMIDTKLKFQHIQEDNVLHQQRPPQQLAIDLHNSIWGRQSRCDNVIFVPLFEAIIATVWLVIFMMCGHGGHGMHTMLIKPWRLVMPAIMFFSLMTILSVTHTSILNSHLSDLCHQLRTAAEQAHATHTSCGTLIELFSPKAMDALRPASNYYVLTVASVIKVAMWLLALLIMMVRVLFAVDFRLMRVTVIEQQSLSGTETQETTLVDDDSEDDAITYLRVH